MAEDASTLAGASVFISVPCMDGKPALQMTMSLDAVKVGAARAGVSVHVHWECQESFIQRARNNAAARFLDDARFRWCTHLMTWDSDIATDMRGGGVEDNLLLRLLADDKDVVGGLYACKSKACKCSSVVEAGADAAGDLVEMRWLSAGCMLVKRGVIMRLADEYPHEEYDGDADMAGAVVHGIYNAFIAKVGERQKLLSEDWAFCERWRRVGGRLWADRRIPLAHVGACEYRLG